MFIIYILKEKGQKEEFLIKIIAIKLIKVKKIQEVFNKIIKI